MKTDVHLYPEELVRALREDVARGLTSAPKELPPKWFYDERGSQLFDEITRLPEYYPTRREREILDRARRRDRRSRRAPTRSSSSARGRPRRRASCSTRSRERGRCGASSRSTSARRCLREAAAAIDELHPGTRGPRRRRRLRPPPRPAPDSTGAALVAFLGGTIGNFPPDERARFLKELSRVARRRRPRPDRVRPREGRRPPRGGVQRRGRRDRRLQPQRPARDQPRARRRLRRRRVRARRVLRHGRGVDRDAAADDERAARPRRRARSRRRLRGRRGDPHRDQREVPPGTESSASSRTPGCGRRRWWTDAAGDFGLVLAAAPV